MSMIWGPTTFYAIAPCSEHDEQVEAKSRLEPFLRSMVHRKPITLQKDNVIYKGVVNSIEAEDGSGHRFIIRIENHNNWVYLDVTRSVYSVLAQ